MRKHILGHGQPAQPIGNFSGLKVPETMIFGPQPFYNLITNYRLPRIVDQCVVRLGKMLTGRNGHVGALLR